MLCNKCGKQVNNGAQFCVYCGEKIESRMQNNRMPDNNQMRNVPNKETKHTVPIVVAAVVVIIAVFCRILSGMENDVTTSGSVSTQEEIDVLVGYIDQSEKLWTESVDELERLKENEEAPSASWGEQTEVLENLFTELSALQQNADAISGLDQNIKEAGQSYFSMACDSVKAAVEIYGFMADYFKLYETVLVKKPQVGDKQLDEYYTELSAWFEEAKAGYSGIESVPSSVESEWEKYGETLNMNGRVLEKIENACQCQDIDILRLYSADNLSSRYDIVEEVGYDQLLSCLSGEWDHVASQRNIMTKLAEEIQDYAGKEADERESYQFEAVRTGKILLSYDTVETIYPSLYASYDALLTIKTGCLSGSRKIVVEAEIPGFTQTYKESFKLDSSYKVIYVKPPLLTDGLDLSSAKDAQLNVTISEQDGSLIEAKSFPITLKSKYDFELNDDIYGVVTRDNLLCFLTPESPAITKVKRQAIEELSPVTNGKMEGFIGYQSGPYKNETGTYLQAAGIMRALYTLGVRYNMDTFSISGSNQHILFPDDVIEQQSGLCIETSLVVASALQSAGMHAFLILPTGHAQVALETWQGSGQYFLIETTCLSQNSNNWGIFAEAANGLEEGILPSSYPIKYLSAEEWITYIKDGDAYVIDCDDVRELVPALSTK